MSKFRAENGRLQTHQPRKWNSHYRAEPEQRILCLFLLIFNFALAGAQTDQSQNLPWKNETRGLSKSAITQFLLFFNTCYHYLLSISTPSRSKFFHNPRSSPATPQRTREGTITSSPWPGSMITLGKMSWSTSTSTGTSYRSLIWRDITMRCVFLGWATWMAYFATG